MQVHVATFLASSLSGLALLSCLMVISNIYNDVQACWTELDGEMDTFRTSTDDMWKDLMTIAASRVNRNTRDAYKEGPHVSGSYEPIPGAPAHEFVAMAPGGVAPTGAGCQCRGGAENKCRAGPPGSKGNPGVPGPNGIPGIDGKPGVDSQDVTPESQTISTCFNCPPGPPGSPGPMGRPGPRGMKGADGQQGKPGKDGNPGHPGEMGGQGVAGKQGPAGPTGEKGLDGRKPIGRPGPKGQRGAPGDQGPQGDNGHDGPQGPVGPTGPPGGPGPQGGPGNDGPPGPEGKMGRPGHDAEYCPCPPRKAGSGGFGSRGDSYKRQ